MSTPHEDDTILDSLSAQVRAFPPLASDEIAGLLTDARSAPGGAAAERLVEHHLGVALDSALAHRDAGVDVGDLYQEGTLALLVAVNEYVSRSGPADGLTDYLRHVVDTHLQAAIADAEAARQADAALVEAAEKLDTTEIRLAHDLGREPTTAELAQALDWPLDQVRSVQAMVRTAREDWDEEIIQYLDDEDPPEDGE